MPLLLAMSCSSFFVWPRFCWSVTRLSMSASWSSFFDFRHSWFSLLADRTVVKLVDRDSDTMDQCRLLWIPWTECRRCLLVLEVSYLLIAVYVQCWYFARWARTCWHSHFHFFHSHSSRFRCWRNSSGCLLGHWWNWSLSRRISSTPLDSTSTILRWKAWSSGCRYPTLAPSQGRSKGFHKVLNV